MDTLAHIAFDRTVEFRSAVERIASQYAACSGPCHQGRVACPQPAICFAEQHGAFEPVTAEHRKSFVERMRDAWYRHVVDHRVWE